MIVGATLLLVGTLTVGGVGLLLHDFTSSIHQDPLLGAAAATRAADGGGTPAPASISGPLNILLMGSDEREGDPTDGAR